MEKNAEIDLDEVSEDHALPLVVHDACRAVQGLGFGVWGLGVGV